jgi:hypothetical protein
MAELLYRSNLYTRSAVAEDQLAIKDGREIPTRSSHENASE